MRTEMESHRTWAVVASFALGAAAMYFLDPDKGRRRRAIVRDRSRSAIAEILDFVNVDARDAAHRVQGARAQAQRFLDHGETPDDLKLIERVRARLGRVVSHPHAIQVGAYNGRVTLSGPILAGEVLQLLEVVSSVRDVLEVEDHLDVHARPDSIPSLQGVSRRSETHAQTMRDNWPPALRIAAIIGGGLLAAYGMTQRGLTGVALAGAGLGVTIRGSANAPISRLAGIGFSIMLNPPTVTVPSVGGMKPVIIRIDVDFPAPFGPRKPSTSPRSTANDTPSTARFAPNVFTKFSTFIMAMAPNFSQKQAI